MIACVIGSAECWRADFDLFRTVHDGPFAVFAVNDAGWLYDGYVDHWVTLHPEHYRKWLAKRDKPVGRFWTSQAKAHRLPSDWVPGPIETVGHWGPGSSSLFAVTVALHLGFSRVLLCGVPMDSRPHADGASEWNGEAWPTREVEIHREGWTFHREKLGGVRSMSGWTRDLLGHPDNAFLYDKSPVHAIMASKTVLPPMDENGSVAGAYWHCPSCGDTAIHRLTLTGSVYHCSSCGRDFTVLINPRPWWQYDADTILEQYPPNLRGER